MFIADYELPEVSISAGFILDVHRDIYRQPPELPSPFHHDARVILTSNHRSGQRENYLSEYKRHT